MKLTLDTISKCLNGNDLFTDFSLELQNGMKLCICGPNGVGKSVLIKIMAGREAVDKGNVLYGKGIRIGYAEQELSIDTLDIPLISYVQQALPNWDIFWNTWKNAMEQEDTEAIAHLTTIQNQWEERYGYTPEHHCTKILFGLGFTDAHLNLHVSQLSGGFRERAKLARVLIEGADILLLDEPINHLDIDTIEWLERFLLDFEGITVFIAHDRVFMDTVATHTLYLGGAKPFFRKGSYSDIIEHVQEIEEQKLRKAQQIEKELEDKIAFIEHFKAKASKARQAMSRQKTVKKLEKELSSLRPEKKRPLLSFQFPTPQKAERTLLVAEDITKHFGGDSLWNPLTFTIYSDSVIALVGSNGVGKSTLLRIMLGEVKASSGTISKSSSLRIGYFSQFQSDILHNDASVLEEIRRLAYHNISDEELMGVLGRFLLGQQYFQRPIASLSGGEKNRLILASIFLSKANMLILDEPTNHLDLETRQALTTALTAFTGAIVLIAHDRYLLQHVAKEYWYLTQHGITSYATYQEYIEGKIATFHIDTQERPVKETSEKSVSRSKEERKKQKQHEANVRATYYAQYKPLQEQYITCEQRLENIYQRISEIEITLSLPEIYEHPTHIEELSKERYTLQQEMDAITEELIAIEEHMQMIDTHYKHSISQSQ